MIMEDQYAYRTLQPSRGIRLLRLLPSEDVTASLRGGLIEYSLEEMYTEASSYDALSYAWGDPEMSQAITIDGLKLPITANLHAALMHLRHRHVERLLWVDQLCIDQNNEKEKEGQIKLMSQIYAGANCVTVWLGEDKDESNSAMEDLRTIGRERFTRSEEEHVVSDRVSRLLERPWFHRIWVLQEVGVARRIQIRCGRSVIDGHAFALAAEVLKSTSETCAKEQALHNKIQSAAFLIKQSIFKPPYHGPPTTTGGICSFGELVDMFHGREATKSHDKIYALLGMSSTDMDGSGLLPDYTVPFGQLFERLIKFIMSNQLTVECQDDKEAAVFKGRGRVLGTVTKVKDGILNEHEKRIVVRWGHDLFPNRVSVYDNESSWDIRIPAIPLREGDIIILIQGATEPSIIRVYEDFSIVIVAVAMLRSATGKDRPWLLSLDNSEQVRVPNRVFSLVWDWHYSLESYSRLRRYGTWSESKGWMSANSNLIKANRLDDLARLWECSTIQWEGHLFKDTREIFKICLCECEEILQIRELRLKGSEHINALIHGTIGESFTTSDSRSRQPDSFQEALAQWFITYLFHHAIQVCHSNLMDLLIGTGHVNHDLRVLDGYPDLMGLSNCLLSNELTREGPRSATSLHDAAWFWHHRVRHQFSQGGHIEGFLRGITALQRAAEAGSLAVVERLLEMGADVNAPPAEYFGKTALQATAKTGNIAIVDRLLQKNADVNARGARVGGRTALQAAVEAGQMAIVQRLVQHHADINAPAAESSGRTALQASAEAGHLQIVEYLLEHKADVNAPGAGYDGITALQAAARMGHLAIVERLKQAGASTD
ncbi:hypothetical protein G7054_g10751 [Neopestalotiopsis clavispora]|nr:hypothetical protein G7054_g10751 [Neopestalotiopsis clavispora]